jgi:hypothetical protein
MITTMLGFLSSACVVNETKQMVNAKSTDAAA